jgi:glutathione synthase/RimK-type ligase-like ATP-grasp enzyme
VFGNILEKQGERIILSGLSIKDDNWIPKKIPVDALHDRFPSQIRSEKFQSILPYTKELFFGNPFAITMLCRDKIATQRYLEKHGIQMPEIIIEHQAFSDQLAKWNSGFIKPQFGALGKNVQTVTADSLLPEFLEGVVPKREERTFIQRAITPPRGWKGLSLRQLVQRSPDGSWQVLPAVLRRSREDVVVNIARGAEAVLAEDHLPASTMEHIYKQSIKISQTLQKFPNGEYSVEFGLDFVIDQNYHAWLIEVNSRPRGRLEVLAKRMPERFESIHQRACLAPILYLAKQVENRSTD